MLTYSLNDRVTELDILKAAFEPLSGDEEALRKKEGLSLLDLQQIAQARGSDDQTGHDEGMLGRQVPDHVERPDLTASVRRIWQAVTEKQYSHRACIPISIMSVQSWRLRPSRNI